MRILWVKAGKLLPVDTGGKIRSYNLLRQLARRHQITLLTYYRGQRDAAYEAEIDALFPGAITLADGSSDEGTLRSAMHYLSRVWKPAPYAVSKFTSRAVTRVVTETLEERRADVAVCDFLSASLNFPRSSPVPSVLFQHNVESQLWRRQATHERVRLYRLVYRLEALKMRRYETAAVRRFNHVIAVSEQDRDAMRSMTSPDRVTVVPTGVDMSQYGTGRSPAGNGRDVIFLGSMDWEANVDAVEYFCHEIWPSIRRDVPDARFLIVGRNPTQRVLRLASESVIVTGRVESVLPYLKDAAVFAVPLRIGGGTRLKIFEAMAAGKAVVSTPVGAEGLDVRNGHDILLEDTPAGFAASTTALLRNAGRREALGEAAVALAARHDWSAVIRSFEAALERARVDAPRQSPVLAGARA